MKSEHIRERDTFSPELCITPAQTAKRLHLGRTKTYQLLRQKIIPNIKIGNRILIPTKELEKWLSQQSAVGSVQREGGSNAS